MPLMAALGSGHGTDIGIERRPVRGDETPISVETPRYRSDDLVLRALGLGT